MPNKEFLEEYPLYRTFETEWVYTYLGNRPTLRKISKPTTHMQCAVCKSDQTFNMVNEYWELEESENHTVQGKTVRADYLCRGCHRFHRLFFINFYEVEREDKEGEKYFTVFMRKVGQLPAWSVVMDNILEEMLGEHAEYYRRGLITESQSYGIGAYAYYRRITEDVLDELLENLKGLISEEDKEKYLKALEGVKKTKVAEEKIKLVADLLPPTLTPKNYNPLKVLYKALSVGLHGKSDEECLEQAEIIRKSLVFLVNEINRNKKQKQEFTESMKTLLGNKKTK